MRYWWVNHKQTAAQELAGGYLWSPVTESNGARSRFYDNMRLAEPGDIVLSYASGLVGRVGVVAELAISAPRPAEFGTRGAYWSATGWLLPVRWLDQALSVRPKDILDRLGPLLPETHSPIQPATGNGNQKAYLAEVNRGVIALVLEAAGLAIGNVVAVGAIIPGNDVAAVLDDEVQRAIDADLSLDDTTRRQLTMARRGQGIFRRNVMDVEPVCRITGISNPLLLRASHIKPWRACETAQERLDGFNGLMLAPHVDFLFDRGLLGFTAEGGVLLSTRLDMADREKLGLRQLDDVLQTPFREQSARYLEYHRQTVFIGG